MRKKPQKKASEKYVGDQPDVVVTRAMIGLTGMQACVRKGQSDESILLLANHLNPCGTQRGWTKIIHKGDKDDYPNSVPIQCEKYSDREHVIILC